MHGLGMKYPAPIGRTRFLFIVGPKGGIQATVRVVMVREESQKNWKEILHITPGAKRKAKKGLPSSQLEEELIR